MGLTHSTPCGWASRASGVKLWFNHQLRTATEVPPDLQEGSGTRAISCNAYSSARRFTDLNLCDRWALPLCPLVMRTSFPPWTRFELQQKPMVSVSVFRLSRMTAQFDGNMIHACNICNLFLHQFWLSLECSPSRCLEITLVPDMQVCRLVDEACC